MQCNNTAYFFIYIKCIIIVLHHTSYLLLMKKNQSYVLYHLRKHKPEMNVKNGNDFMKL